MSVHISLFNFAAAHMAHLTPPPIHTINVFKNAKQFLQFFISTIHSRSNWTQEEIETFKPLLYSLTSHSHTQQQHWQWKEIVNRITFMVFSCLHNSFLNFPCQLRLFKKKLDGKRRNTQNYHQNFKDILNKNVMAKNIWSKLLHNNPLTRELFKWRLCARHHVLMLIIYWHIKRKSKNLQHKYKYKLFMQP